jgi:hypothetical protein
MSDKQDRSRGDFSAARADDQVISDRVQELSWALIDGQISDDEFALLDNLLLADEKARDSYLGCVQLHAELTGFFADPAGKKTPGSTQVLGFLSGDSSLGLRSTGGEVVQ